MVYPGFGVNYKNAQANWANDIAFFLKNGINYVRPNLAGAPIPWSAGTPSPTGSAANVNAYYRLLAQTFQQAGINATWGMSTNRLTTSNWQAYHDSVVAEATYLQSQGIALYDFELGNELESTTTITIKGLTQTGGLATAVCSSAHGLQTGESVTVNHATQGGYNGTFTVTVVNSTTFTYSVPGGTTSPATTAGGIQAYSLSIPQLHINLRQLATDVKAVYNLSLISYGCDSFTNSSGATYADWISTGLGALDNISVHPYGTINVAAQTVAANDFVLVQTMIAAFPGQCYVSEFNLDPSASNLAALNPTATVAAMQSLFNQYILGIFPVFLVYEWTETGNTITSEYGFAQLKPGGDMNPMWFVFFESNPTQYSAGVRSPVARTPVARSPVARSSVTRSLFNN